MMHDDSYDEATVRLLRAATEDDVGDALEQSYVSLPLDTPAAALEFFNRMLDTMLGLGAGMDQ